MKSKKGMALDQLVPSILAIVLAAILLVFGLMMLDDLLLDVSDYSVTLYNETLTSVTETGETVSNSTLCGFHSFSVIRITNATVGDGEGEILTSENYTTDGRQGIVYFASGGTAAFNDTDWNITYSFLYGNETSNLCMDTNSTLAGIANFSDYIDLIVLAVVIAIIISLILLTFGTRRIK